MTRRCACGRTCLGLLRVRGLRRFGRLIRTSEGLPHPAGRRCWGDQVSYLAQLAAAATLFAPNRRLGTNAPTRVRPQVWQIVLWVLL
jgi:hypothetical protein